MESVDTQWRKRTRRLWTKYTKPGSAGDTTKAIKKNEVIESETTTGKKRMDVRNSLDFIQNTEVGDHGGKVLR